MHSFHVSRLRTSQKRNGSWYPSVSESADYDQSLASQCLTGKIHLEIRWGKQEQSYSTLIFSQGVSRNWKHKGMIYSLFFVHCGIHNNVSGWLLPPYTYLLCFSSQETTFSRVEIQSFYKVTFSLSEKSLCPTIHSHSGQQSPAQLLQHQNPPETPQSS